MTTTERLPPTAEERAKRAEHRLPAEIAIIAAVALNTLLPEEVRAFPSWVLPVVTVGMFVPLLFVNPRRLNRETAWSKWLSIAFAVVLTVVNQVSVVEIVIRLVDGTASGAAILLASGQVWFTNAIAFALLYWELDRGGPVARRVEGRTDAATQDFFFPQQGDARLDPDWEPAFVDYGYFSLTNMMAYSPTDVMPLTHRAKGLMAYQSVTAFVLIALVISRAVNILTAS